MTTGIIYCYAGDPAYLTYLKASIKSLQNHGYAGPISVVTNAVIGIPGVNVIPAPTFSTPKELKVKTGQMFQPIRVAVCGRKVAPPLFETLVVLGRETCLHRIERALELLPVGEIS